jgi:glyceraldehyde 3-phosphate dehydrogenase
MMRIAINGMGRIGRLLFRRLINVPGIEMVAVNDIMDLQNLFYLIKHDSVYGNFPYPIAFDEKITCCHNSVSCFHEPDPSRLPWKDLGVDVVLECSGHFTSYKLTAQHLNAGAKKVLLSTTGSEDIPLMIYGFNEEALTDDMDIISPGGCMTNCSTLLIKLLDPIGIESVQINVIHSYTSRQELVDAAHKDFRRGRSAAESIIPVPVDLAHSLERLFPGLYKRIAAMTTRVPVVNGAFADFSFVLKQNVTKEEVNSIFRAAANNAYKGMVAYTEEPLVSLDIKGNVHSAIVDGNLTSVLGNHLRLFAFFDNEYGYTSRMIDWLWRMGGPSGK